MVIRYNALPRAVKPCPGRGRVYPPSGPCHPSLALKMACSLPTQATHLERFAEDAALAEMVFNLLFKIHEVYQPPAVNASPGQQVCHPERQRRIQHKRSEVRVPPGFCRSAEGHAAASRSQILPLRWRSGLRLTALRMTFVSRRRMTGLDVFSNFYKSGPYQCPVRSHRSRIRGSSDQSASMML